MTGTAESTGMRHRAATTVAAVLAPVPLGAALLVFVGWRAADDPLAGAGWGLFAAFFAAALPFGLTYRLRSNRPPGGHANRRRVAYLAVALTSAATGIALMTWLGAPPAVTAATVTMMIGLLASLLVNTQWAISNHTAAAAGGAVILALLVGPVTLTVLIPLVSVVAWARVALGTHTPRQAAAGAALGAAVAAVAFSLLS